MAITPGPATAVGVVLAVLFAAAVAALARLGVARDAVMPAVGTAQSLGLLDRDARVEIARPNAAQALVPVPSSSWSCCWRWRRSRSR